MPNPRREQVVQKKTEFAQYLRELSRNYQNGTTAPVFEQVYEFPQATLPEHNIFAVLALENFQFIRMTIYLLIEDFAETEKQLFRLREIFYSDSHFINLKGGNMQYLHLGSKLYRKLTYFYPLSEQ